MLKICFITDGGRRLGLGHVQQSISLARELVSEAEIFFLTKSDETVLAKISESGFEATRHPNDSEMFEHLKTKNPEIIIFDKLDVAEELARDIKQMLRARLVIFTNLTGANRYADVAVTADIGSRFENVRFFDEETKTQYFYGPKYWVLRSEFYEYQHRAKVSSGMLERVLLIFGGSDPANFTCASLEQLLQLERVFKIDVVLGAHFHHNNDVLRILKRHEGVYTDVTVHRNISNVAELMYSADLVLASPGLSAFEALRVGTPVIVFPQDALQRDTYQGFMRMLERNEVGVLGHMIDTGDFTYPTDQSIVRMEIGEGVEELKEAIIYSVRKSDR